MGKRGLAALALVSLLAPWVASASAAVHLSPEATEAAEHDATDPVHGHHHAPATPEHSHFWVLPHPGPTHARDATTIVVPAVVPVSASALYLPGESPLLLRHRADLIPPVRAESVVILRI